MMSYDISLEGNRYLRPGDHYQFTLQINSLVLDYTHLTAISKIEVLLERHLSFVVSTNRTVPCDISSSLRLPNKIASWYPIIRINGIDQYGYRQQIPLFWTRPIISTDHHPIFDARLGRSNWTADENIVILIKNMINTYGFDCSTIGKEIQPTIPIGKDFMDFEKEWASGGHGFISVLTPRDMTADGRLALPPPWVVTESALSFDSDRPHLTFIEEGVDRVAQYGQMDATHIIGFRVVDNHVFFENNVVEKLLQFRTECHAHERVVKLQGAGQFILIISALYGGWRILDDLGKYLSK